MSVCQKREMKAGKAYPRTCPTCGLLGKCHFEEEFAQEAPPDRPYSEKEEVTTRGLQAMMIYVDGAAPTKLLLDDIRNGLKCAIGWMHDEQLARGWWTDLQTGLKKKRNIGELICLVHSEISEAMEADRKNHRKDDKLPHRDGLEVELADALIRLFDMAGGMELRGFVAAEVPILMANTSFALPSDNVADCLASVHLRLSRFYQYTVSGDSKFFARSIAETIIQVVLVARRFHLDIAGALIEKAAYNAQRADHNIENRKKEGGKAY